MAGVQKKQGSVAEVLQEAILSGQIAAGTELNQVELADSLGVSRMPVREALILLEYQGLVERLPNNHVRVADISGDNLEELIDLTYEMESKAIMAKLVAEKGEARAKADAAGAARSEALLYLDEISQELALHSQIASNMENPFLRKQLQTLVEVYIENAIKKPSYDNAAGCELLNVALDAKGVAAADKALKKYYSNVKKTLLK